MQIATLPLTVPLVEAFGQKTWTTSTFIQISTRSIPDT